MASHTQTQRHGRLAPADAEDAFFREHGWMRVPHLVQWMATTHCPLSCPHCLAAAEGQAAEEMPLPNAVRLIEQVAELGVSEFLVTGGEPLVHSDLPAVIDVLRANGVRWSLNTAIAPGRDVRRAIEKWPPLFAAVSLDGPPQVHDAFRGRPGAFEQAMASIGWLADVAEAGVAAGTTVTTFNFPHLAQTFGAVIESRATSWGLHLLVPEGRAAARPDLFLSRRQLRQLLRFAAAKRNHFPVTMADEIGYCGAWEPMVRDMPFFCGAGKAQCVVLPDGEVVPCTTTDRTASAGNVGRRPLREIWEDGFAELRGHSPDEKCASCRYVSACGGGCWLQRRHGTQCFRDVWRMPRMAGKAAAAVCIGLAATSALPAGEILAAGREPAPVAETKPEARAKEAIERCIIQWYASQIGGRRAPTSEAVREELDKLLPGDPAAQYLAAFSGDKRPTDIRAISARIDEALTTGQRSLCLVGLAWRDVAEWCMAGKLPAERSEDERRALRDAMTGLEWTVGQWRREVLRDRLDPFLRRSRGSKEFLRNKAMPPRWTRLARDLAHERGWTDPAITEDFVKAHPYAQVMTLAYEHDGETPLPCLRGGLEVPADGKLGVFDILLVPEGGVTLKAQLGKQKLRVALPAGAELTYGDILRLADEQNRAALEDAVRRGPAHVSPLLLPALRRAIEGMETKGESVRTSDKMRHAMWQLADLYLF